MSTKYKKLIFSIALDVIGMFTFFPIDLAWAPIAGLLLVKMYKGTKGKVAGIIGFLEEIIPFSDVIPTFTIMWIYTYVIKKEEIIEDVEVIEDAEVIED